jgi:chromate transporter
MRNSKDIKELAQLFSKLGLIAFGGPAAHIAMMQEEVVVKRKWMSEQHYLDLIGATNLIPGPNSTEMAIHIGRERGGWKGLIVAGLCFILPAVILTGVFAWFYKRYGQLPQVQPFIYGIKPAIIAIILAAIYPLAKTALKTIEIGVIGIIALLLSLMGYSEILILFGAGFFALLLGYIRSSRSTSKTTSILPFTIFSFSNTTLLSISNFNLFFIFFKIGAILYGSGYVLFAFLDSEFVAKGLLSRQQLIDAIAVGQFTPGPVFSSVTFIGYQLKGFSGAVVSTIGIFLPSFIFVALLNPLVKKMRGSELFSSFLNAVNIASVAIIIAICYVMGKESITDRRTAMIACLSLIMVVGFRKINSALIVLAGSLLGYILTFL